MATINSVDTSLSGQTGTGSFVGSTSPTLVTPALGAATATSVNFGGASLATYSGLTAWTPVFTFATPGNLSVAYTVQNGYYSRVGNIVTVNFLIQFAPTFTTSSGNALVTGLPFTSNSSSNNTAWGALLSEAVILSPYTYAVSEIQPNATQIIFYGCQSGVNAANVTTGSFVSTNSYELGSTLTYLV
jgi:hypothetical protein